MADDKYVLVSKSKLNALANKFKFALGINKKLTLDEMNEKITNISIQASKTTELLSGTISIYENDDITQLRAYAFNECENLYKVSLKNVNYLYWMTFSNCYNLSKVYLANTEIIGSYVFSNCENLEDVYLGANKLVTLENKNSFKSAGEYTTNGYVRVHVRPEYANEYANATNWVDLINSGQIVIVGDYENE